MAGRHLNRFFLGLRLAAAGLVWLVAALPARAQDVQRTPSPAWIDELPIPKPRESRLRQVEDGVYYLLSDTQVKFQGDVETFWRRNVYKVTDRSGLEEAARLDMDFDPAFEHVVLHRVRILRDGQVLDRLPSANVRVMERESDLDSGVFDGLKTAHVEIKDVEVGDIVDIEYSWQTRQIFWPGNFFGSVTTNWSVPLELTRYRIFWPKDRPLTIKNRNTNVKPVRIPAGPDTLYEWRAVDTDPIAEEDGVPDWYSTWGEVDLSSMANWSEVVKWALPLYTVDETLPPQLQARLDAIAQKYPKPEDRVTAAMRLVEDDLRYVSISIGANAFQPRSPAEVFRSGYGDCKDKSELLVVLLRKLGVEAYVALTDTKKGWALPQMAPATNIYDHAIVQVRLKGKHYWIDATSAHAGGRFPDLAPPDYGYALPVAPGQTGLEQMAPAPTAGPPAYHTVERYTLSEGPQPSLTLAVVTTYRGDEADTIRNSIASKSQAKLESNYLDFYRGFYPGLERIAPLTIKDDRDANRIVTTETYRLAPDKLRHGKLLQKFPVKASSLGAFDKVPTGERREPYQLQSPVNKEHVIELITPGRSPPAPSDVDLSNAAFHYMLAVRRDGDALTLDYRLIGTPKDFLDAAAVDAVGKDADTVTDQNYWNLDLTSTEGGTIGGAGGQALRRSFVLMMLSLIGIAALLGATVFAFRLGLGADDAHSREGLFYPVRTSKFVLMSVATAGLYAFFWMWKCWRWHRRHGNPFVEPFWRAVFGVFWLHALFGAVAARGRFDSAFRTGVAASCLLYGGWLLGCIALAAHADTAAIGAVMEGFSFLFVVPVVVAVNRINAGRGEIIAANSRASDVTGLAVAGGAIAWAVLLVPALIDGPWMNLGLF